jgi:hypothetical protein
MSSRLEPVKRGGHIQRHRQPKAFAATTKAEWLRISARINSPVVA